MAFKFPSWSGFSFTPTLHNTIPPFLQPQNSPLPPSLTILITGASRGIGAEIAKTFAQSGAAGLILTARTVDALEQTVAACRSVAKEPNLKISSLAVDVSREDDVRLLAELISREHGRLDVLVNNAGIVSTDATAFRRFHEMNASQIRDTMDVNYFGRFLTIKYLLPFFLAEEKGTATGTKSARTIIDISSIGAHFTGGGPLGFNISALASNRLIECVADTYREEGVVAYSVHPGMVGNARPPPGMDAGMNDKCTDSADLCGAFLTWLVRERPEWLSGRYLSANWDVQELRGMKTEIAKDDKLRMRMLV